MLAARVRPVQAPVRVAWARIRARPGRGALVAAGVALATAAAVGIAGGGKITADLELRRSLEALPRAGRSFSATWSAPRLRRGTGQSTAKPRERWRGSSPATRRARCPTPSST